MKYVIAASVLIFILLGMLLIPYAGIETDEVLFAKPFFTPPTRAFSVSIFHHSIPLMVFPYIGTLKTLLYWPILRVFEPNVYSVRAPVVLLAAVTILVFFRFADKVAGRRAAFLSTLLLATDPSFLVTNTFDWGPVTLQILLVVTGCLLIASGRPGIGCACFGLALWNKAVFGWALVGLVAGVLVAYLPEVRKALASRRILLRGACGFLLGVLPLLIYNLHRPNATFGPNTHLSIDNVHARLAALQATLDGSILFGYLTAPAAAGSPKTPTSIHGRISEWIPEQVGAHYSSLLVYSLVFALLSTPLWWRSPGRRAGLFALVFTGAAFLAMTLVRFTGYVHHVVLLWPMPHLLVGVAIAALRPKWLVATAGIAVVAANLLVDNQYVAEFERNGAYGNFTDALYPLSSFLSDLAGDTVYLVDWGMDDNLNLLHEGKLNLQVAWPVFSTSGEPQDRQIEAMLSNPLGVFVTHVVSREDHHGVGARLDSVARDAGYEKVPVRIIPDSNGRPIFEIFRFVKPRAQQNARFVREAALHAALRVRKSLQP